MASTASALHRARRPLVRDIESVSGACSGGRLLKVELPIGSGLIAGMGDKPRRAKIQMLGASVTGIGSDLIAVSNRGTDGLLVALYGTAPLQGSGTFLKVSYTMTSPVDGVPFVAAAQANEGQIPLIWSSALPGGGLWGPPGDPRSLHPGTRVDN